MGADDRAAEGRAAESRTAFRRARFAGEIRKRIHAVAGRARWKSLAVSKRNAALTVEEKINTENAEFAEDTESWGLDYERCCDANNVAEPFAVSPRPTDRQ